MSGTQRFYDNYNRGVCKTIGKSSNSRNNGKISVINTSIKIQIREMMNDSEDIV